jgi:type VI protein secretion system component Hcp
VNAGWRANLPEEEVSLSFAQVCWTYRRQNPDGSAGPATRFCFDLRTNRPV